MPDEQDQQSSENQSSSSGMIEVPPISKTTAGAATGAVVRQCCRTSRDRYRRSAWSDGRNGGEQAEECGHGEGHSEEGRKPSDWSSQTCGRNGLQKIVGQEEWRTSKFRWPEEILCLSRSESFPGEAKLRPKAVGDRPLLVVQKNQPPGKRRAGQGQPVAELQQVSARRSRPGAKRRRNLGQARRNARGVVRPRKPISGVGEWAGVDSNH